MRACLIKWWERFRGTPNEDDSGPLSIQSSLHVLSHRLDTHLCAYFVESEICIMHFTVDLLILFSILFDKNQVFCLRIQSKAIGK